MKVKLLKIIIFLSVFALACNTFISCVATTSDVPVAKLQKSMPLPNEPQASFPKMVLGDSWVVTAYGSKKYPKDTYTGEVTNVDQNGSFDLQMKAKKSGKTWSRFYDIDEPHVKGILPTDAAGGTLSFPLFVGKTWKAKGSFKSLSGKYNEFRLTHEVKAFETVNTKAGQFEAFKIKRTTKNIDVGWSGYSYFWYSPKVKAIIKSKHKTKRGANLISYKVKESEPMTTSSDRIIVSSNDTISADCGQTIQLVSGTAKVYTKDKSSILTDLQIGDFYTLNAEYIIYVESGVVQMSIEKKPTYELKESYISCN